MGQAMCQINTAPGKFNLDTATRPIPQSQKTPGQFSPLAQKGVTIWVDSVDELIRALPFEVDADLDHLHALPEGNDLGELSQPVDPPHFPRDVGVRCELLRSMSTSASSTDHQDNYLCLSVDDIANPWSVSGVSNGHGPQGHLVSTLLVHELPGLLAQNPALHRDSNLALYQSFLSVGEMASSCQFIDASISGGTLSAVLLRDGYLHIAWIGDSKIVLGRLAAKEPGNSGAGAVNSQRQRGNVGVTSRAQVKGPAVAPSALPLLRAVELTSDHSVVESSADLGKDHLPTPRSRGLARAFGDSRLRVGGIEACKPDVRRLRIKPEDVFVVLGTSGLWQKLSPMEVVTVVGQNLHRMAADAADALVAEVERRSGNGTERSTASQDNSEGVTVIVMYLAGDRYVKDFDVRRARHLPEEHQEWKMQEALDIRGKCGCLSGSRG